MKNKGLLLYKKASCKTQREKEIISTQFVKGENGARPDHNAGVNSKGS
jgi:hypothetical protein